MAQSRIACIGWGSLVWKPQLLPISGGWKYDGPSLPVEFARHSADGRITLAICPAVARVATCWTYLDVSSIDEAAEKLGLREYDKASPKWINDYIGRWDRHTGKSSGMESQTIAAWAALRELDGVVWTNLPCKFGGNNNVMPTADQVITHLQSLVGKERESAEEYVRKAPKQIDTLYRRSIVQELGWG